MRQFLFFLIVGLVAIVIAACSATIDSNAQSENEIRPDVPDGLVFNVWTCRDLECLNLETSETTTHTYTACAAVMEDAQTVGASLCETRARASVVSSPAICEPTGQACPNLRNNAAYNWDEASGMQESDGGADGNADGGK